MPVPADQPGLPAPSLPERARHDGKATPGRPSWRASGLTWRALLLGLGLTALCDLWIHWAELVLGGRGHTALANTSIPVGAFNILFLLVVINLLLTRFLRPLAFARAELLVIYVMMTVSTVISSSGGIHFIVPTVTAAFWYADSSNGWAGLFHQYIPPCNRIFWIGFALPFLVDLMNTAHLSMGRMPFDQLSDTLKTPLKPDLSGTAAIVSGFAITAALMLLRTRFTWWTLHPVGYAMANTPTMSQVWLPFFIAWLLKTLILRYGGIRLYRLSLPFFYGLIIGDFLAGGITTLLGCLTGINVYATNW